MIVQLRKEIPPALRLLPEGNNQKIIQRIFFKDGAKEFAYG